MDGSEFGPREVEGTFRFLVPVNFLFGGVRPLLSFLQRESQGWDRDRPIRILDVGCGAGDVARAVARWGRRKGYRLRIAAIDRHPLVADLAIQRCRGYPEIAVSQRDLFDLDGERYDYVHASQFLHHFPDAEVPSVLRHLLRLARRKAVVNDLIRAPLHYLAAVILSPFTSPVFRHDSLLSVRKGFKPPELERLLRENGFRHFRLERHFFYRFLLILSHEEID